MDLTKYRRETSPSAIDLHEAGELDIWKTTVEKYESLLRGMVAALGQEQESRTPLVEVLGRTG